MQASTGFEVLPRVEVLHCGQCEGAHGAVVDRGQVNGRAIVVTPHGCVDIVHVS